MYRFVILSFVVSALLAIPLDKKQCGRVFYPNAMRCCQNNSETVYKLIITDDVIECFQVSKDPVSCEREICIAKKKGFATDDDKIDKAKLEELMTRDLESDAELLEDVKLKCLDGDFEAYALPEFCSFMKMRYCVSTQILNHCLEWNKNVECQETKRLIAECVKIIT
ncbi:hypothetical protein PYW08_002019 [Mythimna loreyi]|uniref:Uncharacterized protein n=1 Tax=Mythimna loreyi TaxID=667449 RepID=A0ACC2R0K5_9NEOP|nr:hypothetical protein PYW08_002019 [Mythimna loreyi]